MFCSNCGHQVEDGSKFCPSCGFNLANPSETNAGDANQNQDVAFNGTGLKYMSFTGTNGITGNLQVKWLPEEFDKMDMAQIVSALTEIYGVIHELNIRIDKKTDLINECNKLEYDNMIPMDMGKLVGYGICLLVTVILYIAVGGLTIFLLIGGLLCFIFQFILETLDRSKRKKEYKKRYGAASKERDVAGQLLNDYVDQNDVIIRTAYVILPDYYCDENAFAHMIMSFRNHRATSLGEAIHIYMADKNAMEQHRLMQEQINATKAVAENARQAAASAAAAAAAADRVATSAYYNNLKNS